jgi:AAA15 family ATPase/GTPase
MIKAFSFMREFILNSSKETNAAQSINVQPFRLSSTVDEKMSMFEAHFIIDGTRYKYGFFVNEKYVHGEWLIRTIKRKDEPVFVRAKQDYNIDRRFRSELKGKADFLSELTRPNSLFLSVMSQFNIDIAQQITKWFADCIVAHDTDHLVLIDFSARLMGNPAYRKLLNDIIKNSGLGIESIEEKIKEFSAKSNYSVQFLQTVFSDEIKSYTVKTKHKKYDEELKFVENVVFDLIANESLGTQKYFGLLGPILLALKEQRVFFIDEIDARLHTLLLQNVVDLFNSTDYNPNGAQLIFTSHNTNMLKKKLRRDQMIFVEKDRYGVSTMDSLYHKSPKVRNDASFDKDYLLGKYGAIPLLPTQLNLFDVS